MAKYDNRNTGAIFKYAGAFRGMFDFDGVQCDAVLVDGKLAITLKGVGALIAAARLPTLPTEEGKPVKFTLVCNDPPRTKLPMVVWRAENAENGVFFQLKPDNVTVELPAGVDALLG
jgi:hypothetical protein